MGELDLTLELPKFMTFLTGMETSVSYNFPPIISRFMTFLTGMETDLCRKVRVHIPWFMTFLTGMETDRQLPHTNRPHAVHDLPNRDGNDDELSTARAVTSFMTFLTGMETSVLRNLSRGTATFMTFLTGMETATHAHLKNVSGRRS